MKDVDETFVIGVAGIGGYAGAMTDLVLELEEKLVPPVRLAAVCDPAVEQHAERVAELRGRGVQVFDAFEKLLQVDAIEGVWLPLPIDLHRPFMEQALAAGKAVLCEKPAAGTVDEVDGMIAARDRAGLPAIIGFQDVYDATTLPLKRRLLAGEFGPIRRVSLYGCWPRAQSYFARATWAGRMKRQENWVLDSPVQNAMSHYLNIALFLLGADEASAATPVSVEAELYRAAPIENYDTVSARVTLEEGPYLLVLLTHACAENHPPVLRIEGERGSITWTMQGIEVQSPSGREQIKRDGQMRPRMVQRFVRLARGLPDPETAVATLEVARQHTVVVNGISEATPVRTISPAHIKPAVSNDSEVHAVAGIEAAFAHCAANYQMLHESGRFPFTQAAGRRDLRHYHHFAGPHPDNALHTPMPTRENAPPLRSDVR
ncbi:MAG: Gfo/Idh/MocA family oxidoreductase [Phycisphaeraceae bacterium]